MKLKKGQVARYERMKPEELREATKAFDEEMVVDKSLPLTAAERKAWETARRKPGRPRRGGGAKVISVSVERGLLARSDALAKKLGLSRASLIELASGPSSRLEAGCRAGAGSSVGEEAAGARGLTSGAPAPLPRCW